MIVDRDVISMNALPDEQLQSWTSIEKIFLKMALVLMDISWWFYGVIGYHFGL